MSQHFMLFQFDIQIPKTSLNPHADRGTGRDAPEGERKHTAHDALPGFR